MTSIEKEYLTSLFSRNNLSSEALTTTTTTSSEDGRDKYLSRLSQVERNGAHTGIDELESMNNCVEESEEFIGEEIKF